MKYKQQKITERRSRNYRDVHSFIIKIIFFILIVNISLTEIIKGTELKKAKTNSTTADSLTLIYNNIDAFNFPRIVSIVTVTSDAGLVIENLDEDNFMVFEDRTRELPIKVIELTNANVGVNVVLVIDRSLSMKGQPVDDAKFAGTLFVDLMQSKDHSAVVSFAKSPRTDCPFSNNKDSLKTAISNIVIDACTAIYDAIIHSVNLMTDDMQNRVIILLTDGGDNSSYSTYEEALTACLSNEIRVFTIGLGLQQNSSEEDILKNLASETGGLYYYSPTSDELQEIYEAISKLLHHRYQISYTTHNPAKDGTLRHIQIDVVVNTSTSWDTASYRAPYEPGPVDVLDPIDPEPMEPPIEVIPNPFTPNDDGFNDWAEFKKGDEFPEDWNIAIMDRSGRLIRNLSNGETIWDGKDKSSKVMLPGTYLYIITSNNRVIHRGLIQLVR